eukprot:403374265
MIIEDVHGILNVQANQQLQNQNEKEIQQNESKQLSQNSESKIQLGQDSQNSQIIQKVDDCKSLLQNGVENLEQMKDQQDKGSSDSSASILKQFIFDLENKSESQTTSMFFESKTVNNFNEFQQSNINEFNPQDKQDLLQHQDGGILEQPMLQKPSHIHTLQSIDKQNNKDSMLQLDDILNPEEEECVQKPPLKNYQEIVVDTEISKIYQALTTSTQKGNRRGRKPNVKSVSQRQSLQKFDNNQVQQSYSQSNFNRYNFRHRVSTNTIENQSKQEVEQLIGKRKRAKSFEQEDSNQSNYEEKGGKNQVQKRKKQSKQSSKAKQKVGVQGQQQLQNEQNLLNHDQQSQFNYQQQLMQQLVQPQMMKNTQIGCNMNQSTIDIQQTLQNQMLLNEQNPNQAQQLQYQSSLQPYSPQFSMFQQHFQQVQHNPFQDIQQQLLNTSYPPPQQSSQQQMNHTPKSSQNSSLQVPQSNQKLVQVVNPFNSQQHTNQIAQLIQKSPQVQDANQLHQYYLQQIKQQKLKLSKQQNSNNSQQYAGSQGFSQNYNPFTNSLAQQYHNPFN